VRDGILAITLVLAGCSAGGGAIDAPVPATLAETGLYDGDVVAFAPQYPLWTDGAGKRRWLQLPAGTAIDAADLEHWRFPVGTRFWKEFSFGRRIETRYMVLTAAGWRHATYVWNTDGSEARLAPAAGVDRAAEIAPGAHHRIPAQADCRACHDDARPVLGFGAVQLGPALPALAARGLITGLPAAVLAAPPRIAARSADERAALGYLHGNCGGCHNPDSTPPGLDLVLAYPAAGAGVAPALATTVGRASSFAPGSPRIAAGHPERSLLVARMRARDPITQMPPLGTVLADAGAVALVERWIATLPPEGD
jgi:hypothetical protein